MAEGYCGRVSGLRSTLALVTDGPNHRLVDIDEFVGKLWQTHLAVKKEGYVQVRL